MKIKLFFLILFFGLPFSSAFDGSIQMEKFGLRLDGQSQVAIFRPMAIKNMADGSLIVLDRGDKRVKRIDTHGSLLGEFGRSGQGPGEFVFPVAMITVGPYAWVYDSMKSEFMKFEIDTGKYLESRRFPRGYAITKSDHHFVFQCSKGDLAFYYYDWDLNQIGAFGKSLRQTDDLMKIGDFICEGAIDPINQRFFAFFKNGKFFEEYSLKNWKLLSRRETKLDEFAAERSFDNRGSGQAMVIRNGHPVSSVSYWDGYLIVLVNDEHADNRSFLVVFDGEGHRVLRKATPEYFNNMSLDRGIFSFFNYEEGILQQFKIKLNM